MHPSTTIRLAPFGINAPGHAPNNSWRAVARAAWHRWRARQATRALRRRALAYAAAQSSFAEDLAAATGCTLADLAESAAPYSPYG